MLAGWPALKAFDIHTESAEHLPPRSGAGGKGDRTHPKPGDKEVGGGGDFNSGKEVFFCYHRFKPAGSQAVLTAVEESGLCFSGFSHS